MNNPFSVIDKAIIQNAAGAARLEVSIVNSFMEAVKKPITFLRRPEVLMVWGVSSKPLSAHHTSEGGNVRGCRIVCSFAG